MWNWYSHIVECCNDSNDLSLFVATMMINMAIMILIAVECDRTCNVDDKTLLFYFSQERRDEKQIISKPRETTSMTEKKWECQKSGLLEYARGVG
jgi:hypothetical protein